MLHRKQSCLFLLAACSFNGCYRASDSEAQRLLALCLFRLLSNLRLAKVFNLSKTNTENKLNIKVKANDKLKLSIDYWICNWSYILRWYLVAVVYIPLFFCLGELKGSDYTWSVKNFVSLLTSYSGISTAPQQKVWTVYSYEIFFEHLRNL